MKYTTQHHPPPQKQRRSVGARYGPAVGTVLKQIPQASVTDATHNKKQKLALQAEGHTTKTNKKYENKL